MKRVYLFAVVLLLFGADTIYAGDKDKKHKRKRTITEKPVTGPEVKVRRAAQEETHDDKDAYVYSDNVNGDKSILWSKMVCRELVSGIGNSKINRCLQHVYDSTGRETNLNKVVCSAIRARAIIAYDQYTDSAKAMAPNLPELSDSDTATNIYLINERWEFNRDTGKMLVNIQWIGFNYNKAQSKEQQAQTYWIKYADLIPLLKAYRVTDPQNDRSFISCYAFFETRQFTSKIYKVGNGADSFRY